MVDNIEKGDIVQITDENHHWFPCLVVINSIQYWGIIGYIRIPLKGDAYIRLKNDEFEKVGRVIFDHE